MSDADHPLPPPPEDAAAPAEAAIDDATAAAEEAAAEETAVDEPPSAHSGAGASPERDAHEGGDEAREGDGLEGAAAEANSADGARRLDEADSDDAAEEVAAEAEEATPDTLTAEFESQDDATDTPGDAQLAVAPEETTAAPEEPPDALEEPRDEAEEVEAEEIEAGEVEAERADEAQDTPQDTAHDEAEGFADGMSAPSDVLEVSLDDAASGDWSAPSEAWDAQASGEWSAREASLGRAEGFERGSGSSLSVGFSKGERLSQRIQALKRPAREEAAAELAEGEDLLGLPRALRPHQDPEREDVLHIDGFVVRVRDEVRQFDKRALYGERLGPPPRLLKVVVSIDGSGAHATSERPRLLLVDTSGDPNVVRDVAAVLDALERRAQTQSMPQAVDHWTVEGAELLLMSDHLQGCAAIEHAQWRAFPLEDALEILIQLATTLATIHDAGYALGRLNVEDVLWSAEQRRVAINQLAQLIPLVELNPVSRSTVVQRDIEALGEGLLEVASGRPLDETRRWFERDDVTEVLVQHGLGRPGLTQVLLGALGASLEGRYTSMGELVEGLLQIRVEMSRPLVVRVGMGSSVGNHPMRRTNQDSCGVAEAQVTYHGQRQHLGFYCVADGVGGEEAGEWASQVAVSSAMAAFHRMLGAYAFDAIHSNVTGMARALVKVAAQRLAIAGEVEPEVHRGATTFTALLIAGERAGVAHIGDSRACLLRGGHLIQLTRDHNFARIRVALGELSEDEVRAHPEDARRLTRFLDTNGETPLAWIDGYNPALLSHLIQPQRAEPATFHSGGFDLFFQPFQRAQRAEEADWTPAPDAAGGEPLSLHQVGPGGDAAPSSSSSQRSVFDAAQEEDARVGHLVLAPGDRVVLMSDGVYNELPDDALRRCLSHGDPEICVQRIIQSALSTIALDNVGLVVVSCERLSPNLVLARGSMS